MVEKLNTVSFHNEIMDTGITKAVRHARMAHKATEWRIKKELTGPVMRPSREIASKTYTTL